MRKLALLVVTLTALPAAVHAQTDRDDKPATKAAISPSTGVTSKPLDTKGGDAAPSDAVLDPAQQLALRARQLYAMCVGARSRATSEKSAEPYSFLPAPPKAEGGKPVTSDPLVKGRAAAAMVCDNYCQSDERAEGNLCLFRSQPKADAALMIGPTTVHARLAELDLALAKDRAELSRLDGGAQLVKPGVVPNAGMPDISGVAVQFLSTAISGLAKFVVDRAKREAIGWALDRLSQSVCKDAHAKLWLPNLCALAGDSRLSGFGAGAAMLETVRGALQKDVQSWPSYAGSIFATEAYAKAISDDLSYSTCLSVNEEQGRAIVGKGGAKDDDKAKTDERVRNCAAADKVGAATARLVDSLIAGKDPASSIAQLGDELHAARAMRSTTIAESNTEVLACALEVPAAMERAKAQASTRTGGGIGIAEAAALVLVTTPGPCGDLMNAAKLSFKDDAGNKLEPLRALGSPSMLAVLARVDGLAGRLEPAFQSMLVAHERLVAARKAFETLGANSTDDARLAVAHELGHAFVGLSRVSSDFARVVLTAAQDPALGTTLGLKAPQKLLTAVDEADRWLSLLDDVIDARWSSVLPTLLAKTQSLLPSSGPNGSPLTRHLPLLVAIVEAKNADDIATALDELANPIGSWKSKGDDGAFTFSLTSHVGFAGGLEWRHGQYGFVYEHGNHAYAQAPTLAAPIGLEFAWGRKSWLNPFAIFVPFVDPAAFLEYDASQGGKLPSARLLTALAPGLGLRFGIDGTPFSLMPMFTYRPGFRAVDTNALGQGADAFQFLVLASVDVTLFDLTPSPKGVKP